MKLLVLIAILFSVVSSNHLNKHLFNKFIKEHNKVYKSIEEYLRRLSVFTSNLKHAASFDSFSPFMDLTKAEFKKTVGLTSKTYSGNPLTSNSIFLGNHFLSETPERLDYRELGVVSPVKRQGTCGSCWAFTTTGAIESQYYLEYKKHIDLSEQHLVDCVRVGNTIGCGDGYMLDAYQYLTANNIGVMYEIDYPYEEQDNTCRFDKEKQSVFLSSFSSIEPNEDKIAEALAKYGPLAIAINASGLHFLATGQILDPKTESECDPNALDHAVLLVGYTENYWIIKNSWGPSWNEEGYFRMARNKNACGLTTDVSVPFIKKN